MSISDEVNLKLIDRKGKEKLKATQRKSSNNNNKYVYKTSAMHSELNETHWEIDYD